MPPSAPVPPARALPQWLVSYPNAARGARGGHYADEAESVLTAMTPPSQCYHTVQALSHLRSGGIPLRITSLAELPEHCRSRVRFPIRNSGQRILDNLTRVGACWYPIRNSARGPQST